MPQSFDHETWRARVAAWWREAARDLPGTMQRLGVQTAYGLLTASAFLPLLEAYGDAPGAAVTALVGIVSGVGSNLVANLVQGVYDTSAAPQRTEREMAERPDLRAEYERVLGALDALGAAEAALGDRWADFEARLGRELAAQGMVLRVESGGGAVILGDVRTEGGDFVGRDKVEINVGLKEAPPTDLLRAYHRALANQCRHLPLGVVDPKFTQPAGEGEVALHQVYVNLDVVAPVRAEDEDTRAWGLRLARGEEKGRTPLLEALAQPEAARVVLLGDPGSGKTTFVNYLTYRLAEAAAIGAAVELPGSLRDLWPVRLILREVATHLPPGECGSAAMLWDAVRADVTHRLGDDAAGRLLPYLQGRLLREGGLFLLDGFDEVPEAGRRRRCLLEAVQALIDSLPPGGRVLLTARPYAYADPEWQLPGLPILALAPFNEGQVAHFVDRWYQAVHPTMGWSAKEAEARGKRLAEALRERPRLGDLASRPLLLTLMATLHTSWGQLPQDRANLYEESVRLLLARWQRAREVHTADGERARQPGLSAALGVAEATVRTALERLAYEAHQRQGRATQRDDAPADVPVGEVLAGFSPVLPDDVNPRQLLAYLETRAGLLMGRRERVYAFPHRSFQEYLAACHLADTERHFGARLRELIWEDLDWWREVFLLGVGKKRQGGLGDAVNAVNALVPEGPGEVVSLTDTHWRAAVLAGEALLDLDLVGQIAGRPHYGALLKRVRRWLAALVEGGHLAPRERAEAGDVLGQLGDPRFDPGFYFLPCRYRGEPEPSWGFVKVSKGPFVMGEDPPQRLEIPYDYWIGRYPVTVAQFGAFVDGGGYEHADWWTATGWAWRQGEWDSSVEAEWLRDWLKRRPAELRGAPMGWAEQRRTPNRPVVYVSWFEAAAYCRWLAERLSVPGFGPQAVRGEGFEASDRRPETLTVRLPTEAEWEKAARSGDGRRYPWSDEDWDEERANVDRSRIGHASPVGMYPRGATPAGLHDMGGNVWEWTATLYRPYPYRPDDGRSDPEAEGDRVLRGGSWVSDQWRARCAFRDRRYPADFSGIVGFRVVVSLGSSGF